VLRNSVETFLQTAKGQGVESEMVHRDLEIARDVQRASFPEQPPVIPGLSVASFYQPALCVGGDYYDFLPFRDGAWGIAIGDVCGKGIAAALVMANLQGSLRAQTWQPRSDLERLMANVNRLVWESSPQHFFASLFYAEYQPQSRVFRYVNAGHNPPIVLRRNHNRCALLPLTAEYAPMGLIEDCPFTSTTLQLEIGDVLVAYTDGLTESENSEGTAFGYKRLESMLAGCCSQDPHHVLQVILDELSAHSADCPQADDITVVVMQVKAPGGGSENTISGFARPEPPLIRFCIGQ